MLIFDLLRSFTKEAAYGKKIFTGEPGIQKRCIFFYQHGGCGFAYAHNSYLINLEYVEKYSGSQIQLSDGSILTVSRSKEKGFDDAFHEYLDMHFSQ